MGGKKKTKWRKLPLGELTQGTARGSTVSGSLREQPEEDGPRDNSYDITPDEHQWKEIRHTDYYAQGPPHFYSTNMAAQGQDDASQEETAETDEKPGIFFNGLWIPESELGQFYTANNTSAYEPLFRQVPVFLCPPVMPYCSAPYPHFRTACQSDGPLFSNFCIPSDQHYYYHFTRSRSGSQESEHPFEADEETNSPSAVDSDASQEQPSSQQETNCDNGETHLKPFQMSETVLPELTRETSLSYPYPGYSFGEQLYSVPVYQLLPPPQRIFPRIPWSATQTQRKRRRKRKEYNADYAVIPPPKPPGSTTSVAVKSDLDIARDETACNNESTNQVKGSDSHSVSVTGSPSSTEETKQNDCILNNQEKDDDESAYLRQQEITTKDERSLTESSENIVHKGFPKKVRCRIIDNPTNGLCSVPTYETEDADIAEILSELIQKVVTEHSQSQQSKDTGFIFDDNQLKIKEKNSLHSQDISTSNKNSECVKSNSNEGNQVTECSGYSNDNSIISTECENESKPPEMENTLRKNQNPDLPEVHKTAQDHISIENADSYTSPQNYYGKGISGDSFVQNENRKNLSHGRPVKLVINEKENKFFDVPLVSEKSTEEDAQQNSENTTTEKEENIIENKQSQDQEGDLRSQNVNDQSDHSMKTGMSSDFECRTDTSGTVTNCREDDGAKEANLEKNCDDSLDSITSNESCRDRDRQLSDSHRSSPHSFLSYVTNSEALIRETELELSKVQHLTSRPPLQANQSIYKFAFDENLTDQSETEDTMTPIPSPLTERANDFKTDPDPEDAAILAEMRQDVQRSEIVVHEGDSGSEAGSEDVELLPHRYESQGGENKHVYVNKLSLAVELLRTHENLPYDEEFKRVVEEDEGENVRKEVIVTSKSGSNKVANVPSGAVNLAFIGDASPKIQFPAGLSHPLNDKNVTSVVERGPAPNRNLHDITQGQHRHSHISTGDSGVQSEDSGDELGEEAKETYGRLGFTESEDQELWNPAENATMGYRRFGAQARQRFNARAGGLNPCLCCAIM